MEGLEVRRRRLDLVHACKVLFGLVHVSTDDLFLTLRAHIANQCAN